MTTVNRTFKTNASTLNAKELVSLVTTANNGQQKLSAAIRTMLTNKDAESIVLATNMIMFDELLWLAGKNGFKPTDKTKSQDCDKAISNFIDWVKAAGKETITAFAGGSAQYDESRNVIDYKKVEVKASSFLTQLENGNSGNITGDRKPCARIRTIALTVQKVTTIVSDEKTVYQTIKFNKESNQFELELVEKVKAKKAPTMTDNKDGLETASNGTGGDISDNESDTIESSENTAKTTGASVAKQALKLDANAKRNLINALAADSDFIELMQKAVELSSGGFGSAKVDTKTKGKKAA